MALLHNNHYLLLLQIIPHCSSSSSSLICWSSMSINKDKKLLRLIRSPGKVLTKARDLYIHSLIGCAGQVSYGTVMGCPTGQFSASVAPSRSSMRYSKEPMRSVSFKALQDKPDQVDETKPTTQKEEGEEMESSTSMANAVSVRRLMPRSYSLGVIGRIDEDKPYFDDFEEDDELPVATEVLLRSTSCCFKFNWAS